MIATRTRRTVRLTLSYERLGGRRQLMVEIIPNRVCA